MCGARNPENSGYDQKDEGEGECFRRIAEQADAIYLEVSSSHSPSDPTEEEDDLEYTFVNTIQQIIEGARAAEAAAAHSSNTNSSSSHGIHGPLPMSPTPSNYKEKSSYCNMCAAM